MERVLLGANGSSLPCTADRRSYPRVQAPPAPPVAATAGIWNLEAAEKGDRDFLNEPAELQRHSRVLDPTYPFRCLLHLHPHHK